MGGSRERRVMELVSPDEFQQVVDAFGVPVIELDEHLVVRSINGAAIKRDRRDLSEIVGRPFFESWPGLNSSLLSNAIADVLESKQARIVEIDFSEVQIGRAHVCTPVNNEHLVCSLLLEKKNIN